VLVFALPSLARSRFTQLGSWQIVGVTTTVERVGARRAGAWLPGLLLGIGLGGFVDGILLHQILQWHHMLTARGFPPTTVENLKENTFADGLFHGLTWVAIAIGLWLLWRRDRERWTWADSGRAFAGWMLVGWGLFNLVEGIIDHHILTIHHVRDDVADHLPWDLGFLGLGALLVIVGFLLVRQRRSRGSVERSCYWGTGRFPSGNLSTVGRVRDPG
jgi:uncharacterized membrane protein